MDSTFTSCTSIVFTLENTDHPWVKETRLLEEVCFKVSFARLRLLIPKGLHLIYVGHPGERTVIPPQHLTKWTVSSMTRRNPPAHSSPPPEHSMAHRSPPSPESEHRPRPCSPPPECRPCRSLSPPLHERSRPPLSAVTSTLKPTSGSVQDEELTPPPATPSPKRVRRGRGATRRKR
jgi:hypothetical protein